MRARVRRSWASRIARAFLWGVGILLALVFALLALTQTKVLPAFLRLPHPVLVRATERDARWRQDLHYLSTQFPRLHANAFFRISEEEWRAVVARLIARIPELSDDQIAVEMRRLVAMIGDGHSQIYTGGRDQTRVYPLVLRWFPDGLAVVAAAPDYRDAIGARVVRIDDTDIYTVYEAVAPLISRDNDITLLTISPQLLTSPDVLAVLGITRATDRATYLVEGADGVQTAVEARAYEGAPEDLQLLSAMDLDPTLAESPPLYLSNREDYYWFEYLPASGTLFFQYNRCSDMASRPFEAFARDLFAVVDSHGEDVQRIVVDLRYNGGGNSRVIGPFLEGLAQRPTLRQEGGFSPLSGAGPSLQQ